MSRDLEGAVLLVLGVVVARVTLEESYLAYVKTSLFWPLVLTSLVLLVLGVATLRREPAPIHAPNTAAENGDGLEDGHQTSVAEPHGHRPPRLGLLLLAPVLVLVLVAPPPLGAFATTRGSTNSIAEDVAKDLPPLERHDDDPVELSISEFVLRTYADGDASVRGVPVRLTGFVVDHDAADGFLLSRFAVACCAADATPRQVLVRSDLDAPEQDSWAEVVVVWDGPASEDDGDRIPDVTGLDLEPIDTPAQPYEYAAY